jgi:hypothetical protein
MYPKFIYTGHGCEVLVKDEAAESAQLAKCAAEGKRAIVLPVNDDYNFFTFRDGPNRR